MTSPSHDAIEKASKRLFDRCTPGSPIFFNPNEPDYWRRLTAEILGIGYEIDFPDKPASRKGQTLLAGHTLIEEGEPKFDSEGRPLPMGTGVRTTNGRAKCRCGEVSPPGISKNEGRRWHSRHKDEVRAKLAVEA